MKHFRLAALTFLAWTALAGSAKAQFWELKPRPIAIELGGIWFTDNDTADWVDEWGFRVGLRYDINLGSVIKNPSESRVVVSVATSYSSSWYGDGELSALPILLEVRYPLSPPRYPMQSYIGAGIGTAWVDGNIDTGYGYGSDAWNFAGSLILGAEYIEGWFTEFRYNWNGDTGDFNIGGLRVEGLDASNFSFAFGFRF